MLTDEQRKKAIEEANRLQNIHFIGLNYKDSKEIEVYHRQRFMSPIQASKAATMQVLHGKNIGCVNILTDSEYKQYVAQKEKIERERKDKAAWRVSKPSAKM